MVIIEKELIISATGEIIAGALFLIIVVYSIIFSYRSLKNKTSMDLIRKKQCDDLDFLKKNSKY